MLGDAENIVGGAAGGVMRAEGAQPGINGLAVAEGCHNPAIAIPPVRKGAQDNGIAIAGGVLLPRFKQVGHRAEPYAGAGRDCLAGGRKLGRGFLD